MKTCRNINDALYQSEIERIISEGGPNIEDYPALNLFFDRIGDSSYTNVDQQNLEKIYGENFLQSATSIIGHIKHKPYGYAGDFKIIDRIYTRDVSTNFEKWDNYALTHEAARAVINRKSFFIKLLNEKLAGGAINLLNVASGPARDLSELYSQLDNDELLITDCVELDVNAIDYATYLCKDHMSKITFLKNNIFRFKTAKKYDVIWSAGLFDYLSDSEFIMILKNLLKSLNDGGEIVIGNFSNYNPTRSFMELLGEWFLNHRSVEDLIYLAIRAGASREQIEVDQEPLGINLFLRITHQ